MTERRTRSAIRGFAKPLWLSCTAVGVVFALISAGVRAQPTAPPAAASPVPSPTRIPGVVGSGAIVVQSALFGGGVPLTVGGDVNFEQRERLVRIDVLSVKIPGMDPTAGAVAATQLFPPGGFTVVIDQQARKYTLWSQASQEYYTDTLPNPMAKATPQPKPTSKATPRATPSPSPEPVDLWTAFSNLKSIKAFSLALSGHRTTNGHPTTEYTFQVERDDGKGNTFETHGQVQFADDLDEFPVQLQMSAKGNNLPQSSLRIDLLKLERRVPAAEDFHPPSGYAQAQTAGEIFKRP